MAALVLLAAGAFFLAALANWRIDRLEDDIKALKDRSKR